MPSNKYRIIRDRYAGFEAQYKLWWFPFVWWQCFGINTRGTFESAMEVAKQHKSRITEIDI